MTITAPRLRQSERSAARQRASAGRTSRAEFSRRPSGNRGEASIARWAAALWTSRPTRRSRTRRRRGRPLPCLLLIAQPLLQGEASVVGLLRFPLRRQPSFLSFLPLFSGKRASRSASKASLTVEVLYEVPLEVRVAFPRDYPRRISSGLPPSHPLRLHSSQAGAKPRPLRFLLGAEENNENLPNILANKLSQRLFAIDGAHHLAAGFSCQPWQAEQINFVVRS